MFGCARTYVLYAFALNTIRICGGDFLKFNNRYDTSTTPLPFPTCRANDLDCLRRGLRTFFFLMDSKYLGMKPVDPIIINSVAVSLPADQMSFLLRNINVTGARWTRLNDRKFNVMGNKSGVKFSSDFHITAEIHMSDASRIDPYFGFITIDLQDAESNITYHMTGERGIDNEDYILIGAERIAVRNTRAPTFFLQPPTEDTRIMEQVLAFKPSVLEHLTNEITAAVMHTVVENFRLFAIRVPARFYYKYLDN